MTVEDVFDELVMFEKYNIKANLLMLSGFYNETWDRYLETLDFIIKCQPYIAKGTIEKLSIGIPLFINDKMELGIEADRLGILIDPYNDLNWKLLNDPDNDFVERSRRRLITQLILNKLGIAQNRIAIENTYQVLDNLKRYKTDLLEKINE